MEQPQDPEVSFDRLKAILRRALELEEDARRPYVIDACAGDSELQSHVESILAEVDRVPDFFVTGGVVKLLQPESDSIAGADPGMTEGLDGAPQIPGYSIRGKLGQGGMGVVYSAEQHRPRRMVAIKVIRGGRSVTPRQIRLFQREAQALARLRHPSIATIYEVGRTPEGEHFFAMELVQGEDLLSFVRTLPLQGADHRRNLSARLEIFLSVVNAVAYAHQRGVVHRDLKPANVMVTRRRENSMSSGKISGEHLDVKLLDFGLARITDADVQMTSMATVGDMVMGTLAYMSPEQARGNADEIDIRSDIFSLGVLLFELLTGRLPLEIDGLPAYQAVHRICDSEPIRAGSIHPSLRGELEAILGKAMEKEPSRRYQSANALADDIRFFLAGQPIHARPPSTFYVVRKLLQRYRMQAAFLATLLVLALASSVVMALLWQGQAHERRKAERAEAAQTERLWESSLAQARATRFSGNVGRRFGALAAIERAAAIRPSAELRREVVAAHAQVDLRPVGAAHELGFFSSNACAATDGEVTRFLDPRESGGLLLKDASTGAVLREFPGVGGRAMYCRMNPAGTYLAADYLVDYTAPPWEHEHVFRLWNVATGDLLLESPSTPLPLFDVSDDGRRLLVGQTDDEATLFAIDDPTVRVRATWSTPGLRSVRFDPTGERVALGSHGRIEVRETLSGGVIWGLDLPVGVYHFDWNATGEELALACSDYSVLLLDARNGDKLRSFVGHQAEVTRVFFLGTGRWLVSSGWDRTTRVWERASGQQVLETAGYVAGVSLGSDRLATQTGDRLQVWEIVPERGLQTLREHDPRFKRLGTVDFSPDGRWLASAGRDGVRVWNVASGAAQPRFETEEAWVALFDPDGTSILTAGRDGVKRWQVLTSADSFTVTRRPRHRPEPARLRSGALSATGRLLAVLDHRGRITAFDPVAPELETVVAERSTAWWVAVDPAGSYVVASGPKPALTIWDAAGRGLLRSLHPPGTEGGYAAVSPDGVWLVHATRTEVSVWEVATWSRRTVLDRDPGVAFHEGQIAIAPDGRSAAIVTDGAVKLVTLPDGEELVTLEPAHAERLSLLTFSDDGRRLAVATEGGKVDLWDLEEVRASLRELGLDWDRIEGEARRAEQVHGARARAGGSAEEAPRDCGILPRQPTTRTTTRRPAPGTHEA